MSASDDSKPPPPQPQGPPAPPDDADSGSAKTVQMTSLPPQLQRQYGVAESQPEYPDPSMSTRPPAGQGGQAQQAPGQAPPSAPAQAGWAAQGPPPQPAQSQAPPGPPQPPGAPPQAPPQQGYGGPPVGPYATGSPPVASATTPNKLQAAFKHFMRVYLRRAFRLRLTDEDVMPEERRALQQAQPPVTNPSVQAFLAWRRSLLMVAAVFLVPVTLMAAVDTFAAMDDSLGALNALSVLQWLVTLVFTIACWVLLKSWTAWARQRKLLFRFWLVYFLAPFFVFVFPLRSMMSSMTEQQGLIVGMLVSIFALMLLAPKALSVMPGIIRASIVAKVLFPGASAPGWLMALSGPIYALIVYVILLTPYQLTGNVFFVPAMIGLIGAPLFVAKAGYDLAKPMEADEAMASVVRARKGYYVLTIAGLLFLLIGLFDLVSMLEIGVVSTLNLLLSFVANVLLLGLVGTDMVLVALDRARDISGDPGSEGLRRTYDQRLANFLSETPGTRMSQAMRPVTGPPPDRDKPSQS